MTKNEKDPSALFYSSLEMSVLLAISFGLQLMTIFIIELLKTHV